MNCRKNQSRLEDEKFFNSFSYIECRRAFTFHHDVYVSCKGSFFWRHSEVESCLNYILQKLPQKTNRFTALFLWLKFNAERHVAYRISVCSKAKQYTFVYNLKSRGKSSTISFNFFLGWTGPSRGDSTARRQNTGSAGQEPNGHQGRLHHLSMLHFGFFGVLNH
jgi:hypothetical protein